MKTRAALLMRQPGEYEIHEVDLDGPGPHEVLVRMVASGLCHSDDHPAKGDTPMQHLPVCGGHEGAGVIEAVGPGVQGLEVGDHIVTSFIPSCGRCAFCARGQHTLCQNGALLMTGAMLDGTFRMHLDGTPVGQQSVLGTFSEFITVSQWSCVKIDKRFPLRAAALLGCGVPTGWGSAVNGAKVRPGDVVIVVGTGGVGINAVQGAAHAGARRVIAVDPHELKRDTALKLGATDAFATIGEATELAMSLTNGQGADSAIVAVAVLTGEDVANAFDAVRKDGTVVVTSVSRADAVGIPVSLMMLTMYQKRIQGALYGMMSPAGDVPKLLEMYEQGQLKLDELITGSYTLDEVNKGFADMHAGRVMRPMIDFASA
ncbi:NDMA-dependent alcohol dehydrogenase [Amycolatopsis sp. K13G38]|uniref:NDMA-dependent alcohol dehydrogenase n=1 Tax=Amycolatopsis acididurans TaxID=2724524 RepID=A0ABX1JF81_9PSEU|nr:NDMA-dependent alcohol dehydrogenase [Amycolatopsis acididurans]NKQ58054.1 NDMA-dependent alcohol dehydrogenase [Amycolatopsis acididurans]